MKKLVSLMLALVLVLSCMSIATAEAEKVTLNVWSFTNEFQGMIEDYYAPNHPEVEFNYVIYPTDGGEYTSKLDPVLATAATSEDAPDIFAAEAAFAKKYTDNDGSADLLKVGFTADEFASSLGTMLEIGQDTRTGVQKGLAWQSTPGALFYRADLAEKYLGVTTPEEMQEKVADWDTFMETAAELNEASEGACKMFCATGDIWNAFNYNRSEGWVVDGKLVIDDVLYDYLDMLKVAEEDDLYNKGTAWSETWFAGMRGDTETMCFLLPTWGLHYTIKPNCVSGGDTMTEEQMAAEAENGNGTYGLWRIIAGPTGYCWGGTWILVNDQKFDTASDAKKAVIKDLITYLTLDQDFLYTYAKASGDFVGNTAVTNKIVEEGGVPNPFLGGMDHYAYFNAVAESANVAIMTAYDEKMNSLWDEQTTQPYIKGEKDLDTAIADFKAAVAAQFPEIVVE